MEDSEIEIQTKETDNKKTKEKKRSHFSYVAEIIIYIALILLCVFWVPEHVMQRTVVKGESMENTLHNGESLLVNRLFTYTPSRYDIVVFYPQGRDVEEYYVKRVYGLPGETVQIKGTEIYVNNEKVADDYAKNAIDDPGIAEEPLLLAEDEYFVLGDNRQVSMDSRDSDVGPVKKDNIAGHVVLRIWPLDKFGTP